MEEILKFSIIEKIFIFFNSLIISLLFVERFAVHARLMGDSWKSIITNTSIYVQFVVYFLISIIIFVFSRNQAFLLGQELLKAANHLGNKITDWKIDIIVVLVIPSVIFIFWKGINYEPISSVLQGICKLTSKEGIEGIKIFVRIGLLFAICIYGAKFLLSIGEKLPNQELTVSYTAWLISSFLVLCIGALSFIFTYVLRTKFGNNELPIFWSDWLKDIACYTLIIILLINFFWRWSQCFSNIENKTNWTLFGMYVFMGAIIVTLALFADHISLHSDKFKDRYPLDWQWGILEKHVKIRDWLILVPLVVVSYGWMFWKLLAGNKK